MVIIGVGLMATLQLLGAGTTSNVEATQSTMAVNLGRHIREMTLRMNYQDVLDLHGKTYANAVNSCGAPVTGFDDWSQQVVVQPVNMDRLTTDTLEIDPEAVRVTVKVLHNGSEVGHVQWYRFKPEA